MMMEERSVLQKDFRRVYDGNAQGNCFVNAPQHRTQLTAWPIFQHSPQPLTFINQFSFGLFSV